MSGHHHERLLIAGPAGDLQALYQPGQAGKPAVVVCHPHPLYGGTMRNKVVYWIARVFEDLGFAVVRFNFRGVEQSQGQWANGVGEADDVVAVVDWLKAQHPTAEVWLAGFSFGTYAGLLAAAKDPRIARMFAVAPAVNFWSFDFVQQEKRPLLVISGTEDELVEFEQVQAWINTLPEHAEFYPIEGAGHFFPDHMPEMMDVIRVSAAI
ncbi:MAG: alpha/beta hydrolase [Zetaproteobacteria bacterium CG_4_9_14_3_um_filter_49_83]|nr:MAG: alpha/beta hydrolase [Zetaproteobacteria bacterium CG1_02_49_23]PIQ33024.1 MAG: alpha/beta hydrolase [Zetaproteobacteria bacterium CG17_big_fil_post_rev_8_21_14_2_50_50_13]PIV29957.1 MAG: alpha/beta hydrolase [Zetaproteobacteria bacterium CG02_land_8_20_14_3_00_50_9]PIY55181.1 MAG: alpha/beta hydrolase [Zetaproteobacteria bacterium CG_4_10_14_0_8_um_filter_49_80]PJA35550.1 MAG: alpha/beta hydrolase [Zetaproteobacteria bacterium CG_4_9_14_3_um_filter_49_83]